MLDLPKKLSDRLFQYAQCQRQGGQAPPITCDLCGNVITEEDMEMETALVKWEQPPDGAVCHRACDKAAGGGDDGSAWWPLITLLNRIRTRHS